MQLVGPIDVEDALRSDVAELVPELVGADGAAHGVSHLAPPAPDDLEPYTVCYTRIGGTAQSTASHEHSVSVDAWAPTEAEAVRLADVVCGAVATLPMRAPSSAREYKTADVNLPYVNPDPLRPTLPRATFVASVGVRGERAI